MRTALALLAASAALALAAPALASEPDAPVATATKTEAPLTTAEQIDAFIKSSPARTQRQSADDAVDGVVARDDRKPHGEVSVAVGTGGYRSVYARTDIPVGETGRISLAVEDSRGRGFGRGWYGGPYAPGSLGLADRQRCDLEAMTPPRPLDAVGPGGRCARPAGW
ncbi:hypothetical protein [Phenylobacterium sp.]|uniref:hypothetical protein n=1 Tax=Phenylobacterium sp. TaxID=1871053 RepID=UPI0025EBD705|nr:hypothetical protein [Phenylobacterium sp.]